MAKYSRETVVEFGGEWKTGRITDAEYEQRASSDTAASGSRDCASSAIGFNSLTRSCRLEFDFHAQHRRLRLRSY